MCSFEFELLEKFRPRATPKYKPKYRLSKIQSSKVSKVMWSAEASNMLLEAYYDRNPKLVNLMKKVKGAFVQTKRRIDSNRNGNRYILSRLEVKITVYLPI